MPNYEELAKGINQPFGGVGQPPVSPLIRSGETMANVYQAWPNSLAKALVGLLTGWKSAPGPELSPVEKGYEAALPAMFASTGIGKVGKVGDWSSIKSAIDSIPKHKAGGLDFITDLRAKFPEMPKDQFDEMVLKLSREGKISLHHHDMPGSYKGEMIKDGKTYYHAFGVKPEWR